MQMDQLFQRRGLHTSLGRKVKEVVLTVALSFVPLVVLVVYVVSLIGISTIAVFSWSWTDETSQPHHNLFLLPFAPFFLVVLLQFWLFQEYVKPSNARDLRFAFLSAIIPVRIYLVKDKARAFKYYILSLANIWSSAILSFLILIAVMYNLPPSEDLDHHMFTMALEVFFPLFLWGIHLMLTSSLLLWYFVISPNLSNPHSVPDYEDFSIRLSSFPFYWSFHICHLILQERLTSQSCEVESDFEVSQQEWSLLHQIVEEQKKQDTEHTSQTSIEDMLRNVDLLSATDRELQAKENLLRISGVKEDLFKIMVDILDSATPHDFANAGFFYSHPRMTGLQVLTSLHHGKDRLTFHLLGHLLQLRPCSGHHKLCGPPLCWSSLSQLPEDPCHRT